MFVVGQEVAHVIFGERRFRVVGVDQPSRGRAGVRRLYRLAPLTWEAEAEVAKMGGVYARLGRTAPPFGLDGRSLRLAPDTSNTGGRA
jgi:hypothetical protein